MKDLVHFAPKIKYSSDPLMNVVSAAFFKDVNWFSFMRSVKQYPDYWQSALLIGQFHEDVQQFTYTLQNLATEITILIQTQCPYLSPDEIALILDLDSEPTF